MPFLRKRVLNGNRGFGEDLKELRELRGYTRQTLAKICGIHPAIIQSLEEERLKDFKDPYYAKRHVKLLASALEASEFFLLEKYDRLLKAQGVKEEGSFNLNPCTRKTDFWVTSKILVVALTLAIVGILASYVVWQVKQMTAPPDLALLNPVEGLRVDVAEVQVEGEADVTAKVEVNGRQAVVGDDGVFKMLLDIPEGVSTIKVQAQRRYSPPVVIERHILFTRKEVQATSTEDAEVVTSTESE
ncbi:MAG: helix-turn-helix domain-containing protein [Patescibacteria group bacterium]|nr:helix-turn-helix domain-containing protein [Patescibacteria group bacterium]